MSFFANIFGYVLKFLYTFVGNYGVAIILFSILVKLIMIPISLKQQKAMKKNEKLQKEMQQLQFKYKKDPEKMNQELMSLYKREGMSPFSGCLSSIIQLILLFSVFLLVKSPLTYMVKMEPEIISKMENVVMEQTSASKNAYSEIAIIQYARNLESGASVNKNESENDDKRQVEDNENSEQEEQKENTTTDFNFEDYVEQVNLNMDFFGIDLSQIPTQNPTDIKVLIIPILYVISSIVSIKITTATNKKKKQDQDKKLITDGQEKKEEEYNPMEDANKTMMWMMPIMSVSIAIIAPLGLALYWLMNNILMIIEKLVYNKILKNEEEAEKNA